MVKNIKLKKALALIVLFAMTLSFVPTINNVEAALIGLSMSALSSSSVKEGGSISFTLSYTGDVKTISLRNEDIGLEGFTATKTITADGNNRIVKLSNIKSSNGSLTGKVIYIAGGTAISSDYKMANEVSSALYPFTIIPKDTVAPVLTVSAPNPAKIYAGQTVTYTLTYTDNVGIKTISLREGDIGLEGFTANKKVVINGNNTATVTLSNVQGEVGGNKKIYVAGGTAIDADYNMANAATSSAFTIEKKVSKAPVLKITDPKPLQVYVGGTVTYTLTYTDDVRIKTISLKEGDLAFEGFTADKKIVINSDNTATVTLSNIQGKVGGGKVLRVAGGTAIDDDYNMANAVTANPFTIIEKGKPTPVDPVNPPKPNKPSDWRENPNTGI